MIHNKASIPYIIAGALAALTLLASGVFAAASYVGFLSLITAFNVSTPLILSCTVFSAIVIILSYKTINKIEELEAKNKIISKKDAQLAEKEKEIGDQNRIISEKDAQLTDRARKVENKAIREKEVLRDGDISLHDSAISLGYDEELDCYVDLEDTDESINTPLESGNDFVKEIDIAIRRMEKIKTKLSNISTQFTAADTEIKSILSI